MSVLACAIPTMRISMVGLGKVVSHAVIAGRNEMTRSMRSIQSIGQDIEAWDVKEAQIPGTKIER